MNKNAEPGNNNSALEWKTILAKTVYQFYVRYLRRHYLNYQLCLLGLARRLKLVPGVSRKEGRLVLKQARIACILDEFSYNCFKDEACLELLDRDNYREQLLGSPYDLFFMENTWRGANRQWKADLPQNKKRFEDIARICRKKGIPTAFWNKDDPNHFQLFLPVASLFDYVFTTDENMVPEYKRLLGHERVFLLQFAAQPALHNPMKEFERRNEVCFAGSFYQHKYPERGSLLAEMLDAAMPYGLAIYDRNMERNDERYQFPEEYQPFIRGVLPYDNINLAYKGYKVGLNITTVERSPTMFSRRVYELLASGTPVVSNYAQGIAGTFGGIVKMGGSQEEFAAIFRRLFHDPEYYRRTVIAGVREVLRRHTYRHRLQQIIRAVGYEAEEKHVPVAVLACAASLEELDRVKGCFGRQDYPDKALYACPGCFNDGSLPWWDCGHGAGQTDEGGVYLAFMDGRNDYGAFYLLDLVQAVEYSGAGAVAVRRDSAYEWGNRFFPLHGLLRHDFLAGLPLDWEAGLNIRTYYIDSDQLNDQEPGQTGEAQGGQDQARYFNEEEEAALEQPALLAPVQEAPGSRELLKAVLIQRPAKLSKYILWKEVNLPGQQTVRVRGRMRAKPDENRNGAIMLLRFDDPLLPAQLRQNRLSVSPLNGFSYVYLTAGAGGGEFSYSFTIPRGNYLRDVGLALWSNKHDIYVDSLELFYPHAKTRPEHLHVTVDLESFRTQGLEELIWGRFQDGAAGLSKYMEVAAAVGARFTFYLDLCEYELYGEKILDVGRYVLDQGHDLQVHAHPHVIREFIKDRYNRTISDFRSMSLEDNKLVIDYCLDKYRKITARDPLSLRTGGLRFSGRTVQAARECNLKLLSNFAAIKPYGNYSPHDHHVNVPDLFDLFLWENGLLEVPVRVNVNFRNRSVDQLVKITSQALDSSPSGIATVLLHSWSLLDRVDEDTFLYKGDHYSRMLRDYLERMAGEAGFITTSRIWEMHEQKGLVSGRVVQSALFT